MEKKGRDVPGEEEKQHPSLGDGGGALSEVAGMARKPKTGEKMEMQGSGRTAGGLEGQDGAGRAWRGVRSGWKVSHALSRVGAWGRVRFRLPVGFPLACRSASGGSKYVVGARKRGRRKNSPERVAGVVEIRRQ